MDARLRWAGVHNKGSKPWNELPAERKEIGLQSHDFNPFNTNLQTLKLFTEVFDMLVAVKCCTCTCTCTLLFYPPPLPPVGQIWDVMLVWRKGNINTNCLCVTVLCTIIMVHKDTSSSYRSVDCCLYRALILLGLALCVPSDSVFSVLMVLYRY